MKKTVNIGELLYFDEDKFKTHIKKRLHEEVISDEAHYIKIIRDVIINHERLFITEDSF